ncbi:HlyD family type I secretion periplasmic adaptor subunit [Campylobacter sp. RM12642]|uniref:HlyD family type I secretion periplasmic adaptor subunit n=1 Tax=Campylobacter sp. RM12642 TaxID=2735736 RepID=UPI003014AC85|nr:HlyD family type I secretion periplasmic adaptor subunit [Campylobacter sp. RM12642]
MFKIFKKFDDDTHEFKPLLVELEDRPQNPLGKSILYIVLFVIVFSIAWLILAKVDIVVSASGKVVPDGEIKIIKPLENGVIYKILVKEGDKIKANEPLILVDPSVSKVNLESKKENLKALEDSLKRLNALSNESELKDVSNAELSLYQNQLNSFKNSINTYEFKIKQTINSLQANKEELKRLEIEHKYTSSKLNRLSKVKDIIAYKDYENLLKTKQDLQLQILVNKNKSLELENKLNELTKELESFKANFIAKNYDELLKIKNEIALLKADINAIEFQSLRQVISSPVDGYVGKLFVNTEGSSVSSNEQLISIIPIDKPLIIKANVLNQDIGYLKKGQNVAIKITTFNFQKYGKLDGILEHIGNDAIKDEKLGDIFEIKVKPLKNHLIVDGETKEIEPGMQVIAEVKVGKRRVIEFFIYPIIRYLDEGLSIR